MAMAMAVAMIVSGSMTVRHVLWRTQMIATHYAAMRPLRIWWETMAD